MQVAKLCQTFDNAEVDKYNKIGGPKFATILSLAYRQAYSSTKLTWNTEKKTHWQFVSARCTIACGLFPSLIRASSANEQSVPSALCVHVYAVESIAKIRGNFAWCCS